MEEPVAQNLSALPPHRYPLWIQVFGAGVIVATAYSLWLSPAYLSAAKKLRAAHAALRAQHFNEAATLYRAVLDIVPSSKTARIGAAEALFSNSDQADDEVGLTLLQGVVLDKETWGRLARVLPAHYRKYFHDVKE